MTLDRDGVVPVECSTPDGIEEDFTRVAESQAATVRAVLNA